MLELTGAAMCAQPLAGKTAMLFGFRIRIDLRLRRRRHRLRGEALDEFAHQDGRDRTIEVHVLKIVFELIMNLLKQLEALAPILLKEKGAPSIGEFVR